MEQDLPIAPIIAGFILLLVANFFITKKLRQRALVREGQLPDAGTRVPSIEERIAKNSSWATGEIRSSGRGIMFVLWLIAIVWELTLGVGFVQSLLSPSAKTGQIVTLGVLSLVGIVPLFFAVRATMRRLRFGSSWCRIDRKAGVLGATITGMIRTEKQVETTGDYTVGIQCIETYTTGSGKNRSTEVKVHFETKQTVPHAGKNSRTGIPFSLSLPPYPPETGYQLARGKINWQLRIDAPVKGVDYSAVFVIPVFKIDKA